MFLLNLGDIAFELALHDSRYVPIVHRLGQDFVIVANVLQCTGAGGTGPWNEECRFYFDVIRHDRERMPLRIYSMKILVIDVGGTFIKVLATGHRKPLKIPSGPAMTPQRMVRLVREAIAGWEYSVVSIGYPGPVKDGKPLKEPKNLGRGWVRFNFSRAFGCPVKLINDAAMQALGSYRGGRMLFLGLGTGLGTTLILEGVIAPMELAHLPYANGRTYEEYIGKAALKRCGKKEWRRRVADVTKRLSVALEADDVVLGGGNAKHLRRLPSHIRCGSNRNAFIGGYRLWRKN
jgi:polyphosphate glucokinase